MFGWKRRAMTALRVAQYVRPPNTRSGPGCDVLITISHLVPGGTQQVVQLLAQELGRSGLRVRVAALYRGAGAPPATAYGPAWQVLVDEPELTWSGYLTAFLRLARLIRHCPPHAVIGMVPAGNNTTALAG